MLRLVSCGVVLKVSDLALGVPFCPPGGRFSGFDMVAALVVELEYLWRKLREQCGAYGARVTYQRTGVRTFITHDIPKAAKALDTFRSFSRIHGDSVS